MSHTSTNDLAAEVQRLREQVKQLQAEAARGREAGKQLRFLEARRQSHVANTPLAVILWDAQFRVVEWNPSAERIFGYTAAEAIGKHGCDLLVDSGVRPHVERVFAELLQQSGGARSTNENVTKSGQKILCQWYNTPLVDDQGQVVGAASIAQDVTEQVETAQALGESEGFLRSIVENAPDIIMLIDREARITYINRIESGYTRRQVLGQCAFDFVVPEDVPTIRGAVQRVFATGEPEEVEVRDIRNRHWFHSRLAPVFGDEGIESVVIICLDIHQQNLEQEALRQSEARLKMVTRQIPAVLWTTDRDLRFTSSSGAGLKRLGLKENDVVGKTLSEFFQTDDRTFPALDAADRALAGDSVNYVQRWGDNWYQSHTEALRDAEGEVIGTIGVALDVTQQKVAELERERNKKIFEILAKNVPGVVYLCANDERYTMHYLSSAVEELVGVPAREFLDNRVSFVELFHPDDASVIPAAVDSALQSRDRFRLVYRLKHADGRWIWVEEYGQGVFDEQGELQFLEGTIFDVTAKREAEEAMRRSNEQLEQLVDLRTQELRTANRLLRSDYKRQLELTAAIRASEEKFRSMCEGNPGPVAITRAADGEILYANERMAEMSGVPREQLVGRSVKDFYLQPADRDQLLEKLARDGQVRDFELQLRRADDSRIWVSMSMRPIRLGGEEAILTILMDVTERKLFAEQLQSKMRMLRRMLYVHERDRQLIAYEIHDGIVQYMTGITMHLQAAAANIDRDPESARRDLELSISVLSDTIDEARRLIEGLRPGILEEQGVLPAVEYLCQQTQTLHGIETKCDIDVTFNRLAPAVEMAIFRIVQEGLNNVVKHSKSKTANVMLLQREDSLVIKIKDEGVGFDRPPKSRRYGLTGIRDRARLLGGEARINSKLQRGTRLRIKLPLEDVLLPAAWQQPEALLGDDDSSSDWRFDSNGGSSVT